jgi:glycosyltransferase involved in cell wall biosynthesis
MTAATPPALSVVVPVYNEAGNVLPLHAEIRDVVMRVGQPFEIIFVNDGSTDTTLDELRAAAAGDPHLRILDLDGNFGEAAALCAGFAHARGGLVITLDGDGQNDPADIPAMLATWRDRGCRVVSGWRQDRQEGRLLRIWPSRIANWLITRVTRVPIHDNGCGLKLYERAVVAGAALPRGMNRFMPAIFGVAAADVAEIRVRDRRRQHGQSHYGIARTLVVLRDLLALPHIIRSPTRREPVAAFVSLAAAAAIAIAAWAGSPWLAAGAAGVSALAGSIWWNLRRFNRARRDGVFRLRREYSRQSVGQAA